MRPSRFWVRQNVIPLPARVSLLSGIFVTTESPDLQAIANTNALYHGLTQFSCYVVRREAHEAC